MKSEEFVKIWQQADSVEEAAEKAGMTIKSASNKASLLRGRGVPLKTFKDVSDASVDELIAIAKKYRNRRR